MRRIHKSKTYTIIAHDIYIYVRMVLYTYMLYIYIALAGVSSSTTKVRRCWLLLAPSTPLGSHTDCPLTIRVPDDRRCSLQGDHENHENNGRVTYTGALGKRGDREVGNIQGEEARTIWRHSASLAPLFSYLPITIYYTPENERMSPEKEPF